MTDSVRVALVTGANKGIGFEIARQLGAAGIDVILGARDPGRGKVATERLASQNIKATYLPLDVTDEASIAAAAQIIADRYGHLDILVNNVGIWNIKEDGAPSKTALAVIRETMETNFIAMVAVTQMMLPLIRKSETARIINLTSTLGSLDANSDPNNPYYSTRLLAYNSSKAAVNMFTVQLAAELKDAAIAVNAISPGFVRTDFTGGNGFKDAIDGAKSPVHYALMGDDAVTGCFADADGVIPW